MKAPISILVVDDDPNLLEVFTESLEQSGYLVHQAANGREAQIWLETNSAPALILLDLTMPLMNGWQFREWQTGHPLFCDIPVVILSGFSEVPMDLLIRTASRMVRKPVGLLELVGTIESVIGSCPGLWHSGR